LNQFANQTATCPSPQCFKHLHYSPALTLVVHLERYPEAVQALWENADLGSYGFIYIGRKGNALLWERQKSPEGISSRLKISPDSPASFVAQGESLLASLPCMPEEDGKPWSGFAKLPGRVELSALDKSGNVIKHLKSAQVSPPLLLLPGEFEMLELVFPGQLPQGTEKLELTGTFLAASTFDYSKNPG
jgi:hypothetical protein